MKTRREVLGDEHVDRAVGGHDRVHRRLPGPHHPLRLGRDLGAARASTAARAAASRSRRSSRPAASTSSRCTSAPRSGTGSRRTRSRRCCSSAPSTAASRGERRVRDRPARARRGARRLSRARTQVGIVGAGPAGLTLGHLLHREGIDSVDPRGPQPRVRRGTHPRRRPRAGRSSTCSPRPASGERLQREGLVHHGIELQFARRAAPHPAERPHRRTRDRRSTARPRSSRT